MKTITGIEHDIISVLESLKIEFITTGRNVSKGWIAIKCPYPGCRDHSHHLTINLISGVHHCWICGNKGNMRKLLRQLDISPLSGVGELLGKHPRSISKLSLSYNDLEKKRAKEVKLPPITYTLPSLHRDYLESRGFNPQYLVGKYGIGVCTRLRKYRNRIIIPVELGWETVTLVARDVTGEQTPRYLNLKSEDSVLTARETLYNIDSVKDKAVIVEGITDVWRLGDGAVALMGSSITDSQIQILLRKKRLMKVLVMLDKDAQRKAKKVGETLRAYIPDVYVFQWEESYPDDPAEFTDKEAVEIMNQFMNQ